MKRTTRVAIALAAAAATAAGTAVAATSFGHAGPQGDGTSITPAGWRVTPAGAQTTRHFQLSRQLIRRQFQLSRQLIAF